MRRCPQALRRGTNVGNGLLLERGLMRYSRDRRWLVSISVLTLVAHLLLPAVHALAMAGSNKGVLAGCGTSPQLAAQLRQVLPSEVLRQLDAELLADDRQSCSQDSIYNAPLAVAGRPVLHSWTQATHERPLVRVDSDPPRRLTLPGQARGPPLSISPLESSALLS